MNQDSNFEAKVIETETPLIPTLYMIGNAHLDPVWLWQWQEGFQETKATFRSALDRMKEYDDFIFTNSSAANYEWIENNEPEMFEEIKERINEGRWVIVGGWWVQPDCNIPSGESFVRQGLYGQRYFKEKFKVTAKVGYNVDSFGHNGSLPQILKKSGMDYYVFMRPVPELKGLPSRLFWWESDDGTRVLTYRIPFEYNSKGVELNKHVKRAASEARPPLTDLMCFYGVGNHGGGPTKKNIDSIIELNKDEGYPNLHFSSPNQYFKMMEAKDMEIPVVHDDLQHTASGTYAAHSDVKRWNRLAENKLMSAEKFSGLAFWNTKQSYPEDFSKGWKDVLFNQFHDILAGTSIEEAYEDAKYMYGEAIAIGERALNYAVQSIAWKIDIEQEEDMIPIVIFNPHSWTSKVEVQKEAGGLNGQSLDGYILVDENGIEIAMQKIQSSAILKGRTRISFIAELPPLGYRVYKLVKQKSSKEFEVMNASDTMMENQTYRIESDSKTGFIKSLFDKEKKLNILAGPAARPVVINDPSDTWSHGVLHFKDEIAVFAAKEVKLLYNGQVKSIIRVISEYGKSTLVQDFTMYREKNQIDVKVTVNWQEQHKMLKLKFPVDLVFRKNTYEIPYGTKVREGNGEEEPGQSWIDISGTHKATEEQYGLSILNDGKYSFDIFYNEMSLTVLRSPMYAHHDPGVAEYDDFYAYMDQGIQKFTYSILPHRDSWESAGTVQCAAELNQKPVTITETYHKGSLPQKDSFLNVDVDNVIVSAIKKAEDNDDLILRCYESTNRQQQATISLPKWNRVINTTFEPSEIKTFRISKDKDKPIIETNLLEWTDL